MKILRYNSIIIALATILNIHTLIAAKSADSYGLDCTFPCQHPGLRCSDKSSSGFVEREKFYDDFISTCRKSYGMMGNICDHTEYERLEMNGRQPQSILNYTSTGYKVVRAPEKLMKLLTSQWERNAPERTVEAWPVGYTYTNHWSSPTYMVGVRDDTNYDFKGGTRGGAKTRHKWDRSHIKNQIWEAAKDTVEQWIGQEVKPASLYGIRVYTSGAVVAPKVDRLPLVTSAIVNVAQDVDEDWPLEIYNRQGKAINITMEPGDMLLYESASLIHGRPFPMQGRYYASMYIHFEPTSRPRRYFQTQQKSDKRNLRSRDTLLPPYLLPNSPEAHNWSMQNTDKANEVFAPTQHPSVAVNAPMGHLAALEGDIATIEKLHKESKPLLSLKDRNGWQPIHEAARVGNTDIIALLLNFGDVISDLNERTHNGIGASPLNIAMEFLGINHPTTQLLLELGALNISADFH